MDKTSKILVVGVGNLLMMDEGIGIFAIQELSKKNLPDDVILLDAGTDIFTIMNIGDVFKTIIVIDAVQKKQEPGSIYVSELEKIEVEPEKTFLHQIQIVEALKLIKQTIDKFRNSKILIVGIEPAKIEYGIGLSVKVEKKIGSLIDLVLREIEYARSIPSTECY